MDAETLTDFYQYLEPGTLARIYLDLQEFQDDPDAMEAMRLIDQVAKDTFISQDQREFDRVIRDS